MAREHQVGVKNDQEKDRWDLIPLLPLRYVVKVLTFGAKKYAPDNWQRLETNEQGTPQDRNFAAALRHLTAWRLGEWLDPESGLPHIAHAICDLLFAFWHELKGKNEIPIK